MEIRKWWSSSIAGQHNFISWRVAEELELTIIDTPSYAVSLGDGHKRIMRGCSKVLINLGDATVEEELYVFELRDVDVILGIAWLARLGETIINWREMSMKYVVEGEKVTIRGRPNLI